MSQKEVLGKTLDVDGNGYMTDLGQWTKEIAVALAKEVEIDDLTDKHWAVLEYLQKSYKDGVALTIRRVGKSGVTNIKEFYQLFPDGPLKKSSYIAGIPKPVGCI
ncbi:MAG: TusE/DsrC/DsvC family sulfur relay protein [bacterium]|nr:TusE/DsrC/DsvC family sulfur relay protein [bacterium]